MKRLLILLFALCFLPAAGLAAPEGIHLDDAPLLELPFELVDSPYPRGEETGPVIVCLIAPNGQPLHVVSDLSNHLVVRGADVNFDGAEDLAVMVSSGATNSVYRLFIKKGERYAAVDDGQEEGLFNPVLYPGAGLVESQGTSGLAGALHEHLLLTWQGNRLAPVRRAKCENPQEMTSLDDGYTITTRLMLLHSVVLDYTGASPWEPVTLFEETHDMDAQGMEDAYTAFYQREQEALWRGIGQP